MRDSVGLHVHINVSNFNILYVDRNRLGGGVAVFVNKLLRYELISDDCLDKLYFANGVEHIIVKIFLSSSKYIVSMSTYSLSRISPPIPKTPFGLSFFMRVCATHWLLFVAILTADTSRELDWKFAMQKKLSWSMPWHSPDSLALIRHLTLGHPAISLYL